MTHFAPIEAQNALPYALCPWGKGQFAPTIGFRALHDALWALFLPAIVWFFGSFTQLVNAPCVASNQRESWLEQFKVGFAKN